MNNNNKNRCLCLSRPLAGRTGRPTPMLFRIRAQANPVTSHALDAKSAVGIQVEFWYPYPIPKHRSLSTAGPFGPLLVQLDCYWSTRTGIVVLLDHCWSIWTTAAYRTANGPIISRNLSSSRIFPENFVSTYLCYARIGLGRRRPASRPGRRDDGDGQVSVLFGRGPALKQHGDLAGRELGHC